MRIAVFAAVLGGGACADGAPNAGTLEPLYARPAEDVRVLSLRRGETLGGLLAPEVGGNQQHALLLAFGEQASPRRLRPGTEITLRYRDQDHWLRRVDVEITRDETVRLTRDEGVGWISETVRTPTWVDTVYAGGEIESVLWTAVMRNRALSDMRTGDRAAIIDDLDAVFQWQMDFSRQIRVGDTYRFVYEREIRPDGSMRRGRLLAAEYVNAGTAYHAVYFDPNGDGKGSYYDLEGNSVRRAFLLKPLKYSRISSRFSSARYHPILKRWRAHRGIDYAANAGTEIMATGDGVVIYRGWKGSFGNTVEVRHPNGWVTRYAHMSRFRRGVNLGTRVRQGDIIGYVGMTGLAQGNHLHYEMLKRGSQIDPLSVDLPAGDPVPAEDRARWVDALVSRVALLETVPGPGPVRAADTAPRTEQGDRTGGS